MPLEVMGFLKEEKPTESKTVTINFAQEESGSPKTPPPKAPWKFRTYPEDPTQEPWELADPADPASGSGNHLGGGGREGKDSSGKGIPKGKTPKGKAPQKKLPRKRLGRKDIPGEAIQTTTRAKLSLTKKEMTHAPIIPRRRHGSELGTEEHMWARQYRDYSNSRDGWQHQDAAWRETRNPTDAEIDFIDGSTTTVDFG